MLSIKKWKTKNRIINIFFFAFTLLFLTNVAIDAASLSMSPSSGQFNINSTFTIDVTASSVDQSINAISGEMSFDQSKIEVLSILKNSSIVGLWVQEPYFSNSSGIIKFEGIVLNPGFMGSNGKIVTITFRTKTPGDSKLSLSNGSILANDGEGTDILSSLGSGNFNIISGTTTTLKETTTRPLNITTTTLATIKEIIPETSLAPTIFSETHPDSTKWYSSSVAKFSWDLQRGAVATRLLFSKDPLGSPNISYVPPINSKEIPGMVDGVFYFHAQIKNSIGWSDVAHYKFQCDLTKPEYLDISEIKRSDPTNPNAKFNIASKDALSGISHYEIKIDGRSPEIWRSDDSNVYSALKLKPGGHTLFVKVFDKANNELSKQIGFIIKPLKAPILKKTVGNITLEDPLLLEGTSEYPNSRIIIHAVQEKEKASMWGFSETLSDVNSKDKKPTYLLPVVYEVMSDNNGKFVLPLSGKLKVGTYHFTASVTDKSGAMSFESNKEKVIVDRTLLISHLNSHFNITTIRKLGWTSIIIFMLILSWSVHKRYDFIKCKNICKIKKQKENNYLEDVITILTASFQKYTKIIEENQKKKHFNKKDITEIEAIKKDLEKIKKLLKKYKNK